MAEKEKNEHTNHKKVDDKSDNVVHWTSIVLYPKKKREEERDI